MRFNNRQELENIGKVGSYHYELDDDKIAVRILSSFWLSVQDKDDHFVPHLKRDGFWESWVSLWISKNVKPGSVCIDGGANYGYYTFQLLLHGCKVIAIEANPHLIPHLNESLRLNGDLPLTIINAAITNGSTDKITLSVTNSFLHSTVRDFRNDTVEKVEVDTISLSSFKNNQIDFIKLDIEGVEDEVLPDVLNLQNTNPNVVCLFEWVYDSYPNKSRELYEYIINNFSVSYVDFDGEETQLKSYDQIIQETVDLRMYVLRKKN